MINVARRVLAICCIVQQNRGHRRVGKHRIARIAAVRVFLFAALCAAPIAAPAQEPRRVRLAAPDAALHEDFADVISVRELGDGRVLVADRKETRIGVASFGENTFRAIGNKGQGPNEYPQVARLWPIGRDSSVMIIPGQRWLLFDGTRIAATLPADASAVRAARFMVRGTDARGNVFTASTVAGGKGAMADSTPLLRVARATGVADTIGFLRAIVARQTSERDANGYFGFVVPAIGVAEEPVPFADGWVAVVRINPYRVDWRRPDGQWLRGKPLPFPTLRMTDRERRAYLDRVAKATGRQGQPVQSISDWPETIPPYVSPASVFASPDNRLLIGRLQSVGHEETRYDVVTRSGTLEAELVMPANEHVVGFGARAVYVVVVDEDGVQHLRRHAWPWAGG